MIGRHGVVRGCGPGGARVPGAEERGEGALGGDGGDEGGVEAAGEEDAEGRIRHEALHDGLHERVLQARLLLSRL